MNNKILYSVIAIMMCLCLVGCGSSKSKKISDAYDDTKTYKTMDDIPMPNDYKIYSIEEASKQEWFSQIGVLGEVKNYGYTSQNYDKINATFGYVNDKNLLIPDAIIYQYLSKEQDEFNLAKQKILTKDQYITDNAYEFLTNILKFFGYSEEEANRIIQNRFTLSMETSNLEQALAAALDGPEKVEYLSGWHYDHQGPSVGFNFLSTMASDALTTSFDYLIKTDELARIIMYGFSVDGHIDNEFRVILVYDDLKANIVLTMSYENDDELYNSGKTFYEGRYVYYSDILDEDAHNFVKENINLIKR